jgi:hypothetical protein
MIRVLAPALLVLCLTSSGAFALSLDQLVMRDGVAYKKFTDEPFTGKVDEELGRGAFKNGKFKGPWIMYWSNGQLRSKGAYKNGKREGSWVGYKKDGTKFAPLSGTFRNGEKVSD